MKAKIICRTLDEVREKVFALCKEYGVEANRVFLPANFDNKNNMGIAYAVQGKKVVAASPYWRMEDGQIELQADLARARSLVCTAAPLSPKDSKAKEDSEDK